MKNMTEKDAKNDERLSPKQLLKQTGAVAAVAC